MRTIADSVRWVWEGRSSSAATLQTMLARMFILAINIATGIITARLLAPTGRGEQAAMILWPQLLSYAMTLGLPSALLYNIKRYPDEKSELFSAAVVLGGALGIVATVTGIIFIPFWLSKYSTEVIHAAQCFMLVAPLTLMGVIFAAAFEAEDDFTTSNQARYLAPLLTLSILVVLALSKALTPFTAGLAYVFPGVPIFFWMLSRLWNVFHPRWHSLGKSYKRLLSYGLRSYGIDLLGTLSGQVDQALVVTLLTPASMGIYVVALSLSRMLNVVQTSVITVLFPKAAARPLKEVVALTGRAARVSAALSFAIAAAAIFISPVLLRSLYGTEFMAAVPVFRLLVLQVVLGGTTWVLAQAFMAVGRPGTLTIFQGMGLGLNVPLMLLLIPLYGLEGAGLALLLSTIVRLVSVLLSYPLLLKVQMPSLVMMRKDWNFLQQMFKSKLS